MIVKRIKSTESRRAKDTLHYIADAQQNEIENFGDKVVFADYLNCFADDFKEASECLINAEQAYAGKGDSTAHWIMSWQEGEKPTAEQIKDCVQEFLNDQNMGTHECAFVAHGDTNHFHVHLVVSRVKTEPEQDGSYKIQNFGGAVLWENGRTNEFMSAQHTVMKLTEKYGWKEDITQEIQDNPHRAKLGQRVEAWEAQHCETHPKRILADTARDILRDSPTFSKAVAELAKKGIEIQIVERENEGKVIRGATLNSDKTKVKLSALPKDCSLRNLEKRWDERVFKGFEKPEIGDNNYIVGGRDKLNFIKKLARKEINESTSLSEVEKRLAENGLFLERQGKQGCYLKYGEGESDKIKLSALGKGYSLFQLNKRFNEQFPITNEGYTKSQLKVNENPWKTAYTASLQERAETLKERANKASENVARSLNSLTNARTLSEILDDMIYSINAAAKAQHIKNLERQMHEKVDEALRNANAITSTKHADEQLAQAQKTIDSVAKEARQLTKDTNATYAQKLAKWQRATSKVQARNEDDLTADSSNSKKLTQNQQFK